MATLQNGKCKQSEDSVENILTAPLFYDVTYAMNPPKGARGGILRIEMEYLMQLHRDPAITLHYCRWNGKYFTEVREEVALEACRKNFLGKKTDRVRPMGSVIKFPPSSIFLNVGAQGWGRHFPRQAFDYLRELRQKGGPRTALFCHDLLPIVAPHTTRVWGRLRPVFLSLWTSFCRCCDLAVCVSRSAESDLRRFAEERGIEALKTAVVAPGCELFVVGGQKIPPSLGKIGDGPFILYVSTFDDRKNHDGLYLAYRRCLQRDGSIPRLICVGFSGNPDELERRMPRRGALADKLLFLHDVCDGGLGYLYDRCLFTVYPSHHEGYGMPVAESLSRGKFCLCSDSTSLPEVGGEFCDYFDPIDVGALAEKLHYYFHSACALGERNDFVAKHYKPRSWKTSEGELVQALQRHFRS
jgi:glycosyltransferase involved in cell wall biosynthesis